MALCDIESLISCTLKDDDRSVSTSSGCVSPVDARSSRLSFQSADSKRLYRHRVSFNRVAHHPFISYTLRTSSEGYQYKAASRLFMVAVDDPGNLDDLATTVAVTKIIRHVMDLVDDGDEVVVVALQSNMQNDVHTAKPTSERLLNIALGSLHQENKIFITIEVAFGRSEQALRIMTQMYEPTMLVVGYRKKSRKSSLLSSSSTQATMNQSLKQTTAIPVVFVPYSHEDLFLPSCRAPAGTANDSNGSTIQHSRGHRRTLTAQSNPLPDPCALRERNRNSSQPDLRLSSPRRALRPASIVASVNITNQLKRTFGLLKK
ncbi:hypothetical protein BX666DRAFT_2109155 [Dichotomocladium elegans]|nr:hypothetical protein BX666DRAFT_2109155 [Dichotomocladium elegans]